MGHIGAGIGHMFLGKGVADLAAVVHAGSYHLFNILTLPLFSP